MKTPCQTCPWSRKTQPGLLGGSPVDVYIGQVVQAFWLPCHNSAHYEGKRSDVNEVNECHGAAIMRSNLELPEFQGLLRLPADKESVFADLYEFFAFHTGIPVPLAKMFLTLERIFNFAYKARADANVRMQKKFHKAP